LTKRLIKAPLWSDFVKTMATPLLGFELERRVNGPLRGHSAGFAHSPTIKRGPLKPPTRRLTMLKQLLATSALVVVGAFFIQSASAADTSKLREIVVEPAGVHAPDAAGLPSIGAGKLPALVATTGQGIPTPTQTADAGAAAAAANSAALGGKAPVNQLLVSPPGGGISTPLPGVIANPTGGASADAGTPAAGAGAGAPVTADPGPQPAIQGAPADAGQPAAAQPPAVVAAPAAPVASPAPAIAVNSPDDLYKLLTGRGYSVDISKHDAYGDVIFYVTIPGYPQDAYLLTVGEYGKVKETKRVAAYSYGHSYSYDRPATYAPRYSPAYGSDDNCDYGTGYNAGY
jgi:hypothetical protein